MRLLIVVTDRNKYLDILKRLDLPTLQIKNSVLKTEALFQSGQ
jgi:hypothetical protein